MNFRWALHSKEIKRKKFKKLKVKGNQLQEIFEISTYFQFIQQKVEKAQSPEPGYLKHLSFLIFRIFYSIDDSKVNQNVKYAM